ncbi:MAG: menaquinone biosynthesis protein [Bryobacteraceae bacterium]|nr:menaquinone biosynthesis protein [Bryobacteraceae bacterium]
MKTIRRLERTCAAPLLNNSKSDAPPGGSNTPGKLQWILNPRTLPACRLRVCAVHYLNTMPLVWGMLHGGQRGLFDVEFASPAECADRLAEGRADVGLLPVVELLRQELKVIPGVGIACRGPVRSILLVSKQPFARIRTLAADSASRTSVTLARMVLWHRYGARLEVRPTAADLNRMLEEADAALLIGDPALCLPAEALPYRVLDLGQAWLDWTGLPMVFAVWAGRPECVTPELATPFLESCRFGRARLEEIVRREAAPRGIPEELARAYLSRHIVHELGPREYEGLERFLQAAREFANVEASGRVFA